MGGIFPELKEMGDGEKPGREGVEKPGEKRLGEQTGGGGAKEGNLERNWKWDRGDTQRHRRQGTDIEETLGRAHVPFGGGREADGRGKRRREGPSVRTWAPRWAPGSPGVPAASGSHPPRGGRGAEALGDPRSRGLGLPRCQLGGRRAWRASGSVAGNYLLIS